MTFSLIVPVFNESEYLPLMLRSVSGQTRIPDEIIICDNMSTDDSVAVAKSFSKYLPISVVTCRRKGILYAVETARRAARGDIIGKIDADTVLPPDWTANVISRFARDDRLAALTGPWLASDGNIFHKSVIFFGGYIGSYGLKSVTGHPLLLGANSAFRRYALDMVDGYNAPGYPLDDQLITQKILSRHLKTGWFSDCLVYHSTRRWQGKPAAYLVTFISLFLPQFYKEKQI